MRALNEFWCHTPSGRRYAYTTYAPADPVRAVLLLVHGFGEHGARYRAFAEHLTAHGLLVVCPDLWGHGRSGGARGDLGDVPTCARHLAQLAETALRRYSASPAYSVFGHSFGGLVAAQIGADAPPLLARIIVQSPLFEVGFPVPLWKELAARALARAWPSFRLGIDLNINALCRDRAIVAAYREDPLVHNLISARTYASLTHTADALSTAVGAPRYPVLLLCGADDTIISLSAAQRWFAQLPGEKRQVTFPGCLHELHHEPVLTDVIRLVVEWTTA